ncbi:MAG: cyclic nucleotide-binding domain-containing protein [Pseudomonadota bacterium]
MSEILDVCADLDRVTFEPGEVILAEGDDGGSLFILISGDVAIAKGDVHLVTVSEPGAVFGEMAALLGGPYSATATAVTDVHARHSSDGAALLASRPVLGMHAARVLARRLHAATAYLADLKTQFSDRSDHFGMMDVILEALLQKQGTAADQTVKPQQDPRL